MNRNNITVRRFRDGEETAVSELICRTLQQSNRNDYPPDFIAENCRTHSPAVIRQRAGEAHFYVVADSTNIIGCGGITGYWGSISESYLVSIFVAPEYQKQGIGRKIMEALEQDEYFCRAWRTELGSSLTAVGFYKHLGYSFKAGIRTPDEYGVIRMEKILTLKTIRLHISPMRDDEIQEMIATQKVPELKQAFSEMLYGSRTDPEHRIWFVPWKIVPAENPGLIIGTLGFRGPQKNGGVAIGYGMNSGFEGQGYMTEAVGAAVQWALTQAEVYSVFAETDADNGASQRILQKLGFISCGAGGEGPRFQRKK